jgi:hypothetical protein
VIAVNLHAGSRTTCVAVRPSASRSLALLLGGLLLGPVLGSPAALTAQERQSEPDSAAVAQSGQPGDVRAAALLAVDGAGEPGASVAEYAARPGPLAQEEWTDAWGQPKNAGLAAAGAFLANFLPWALNEFIPGRADLKISQLSPRSWWRNLETGWQWDDNAVSVNFFAHPYQGSLYYNAARSNGYGYWTGLAVAAAGSFHWECCGETHYMSVNDWVNTSFGGAAVGEVLYRLSSMVLDNQATGKERLGREAAAFVLAPTRGFTRMVSGNTRRVYENPSNPRDRVPEQVQTMVTVGIRGAESTRSARGGDLDEAFDPHGFLEVDVTSGRLASLDRQKPFDYFTVSSQINLIKGRAIGELRIHGSLWHRTLSESENTTSKLLLMQDFDYEDNPAFERGGQAFSLLHHQERRFSPDNVLTWGVGGGWTLLGGVRSELGLLSEVEGIRERYREYDFGTGPNAYLQSSWDRNGTTAVRGSYRAEFLKTLNGSSGEGFGSSHLVQTLELRGVVPNLVRGVGIGADYRFSYRRSDFDFVDIGLVTQRAHQWKFFLTVNPFVNRS